MRRKHYSISSLQFVIALAVTLLFASCQKEVNINLGTAASRVVVQGQIETGQPPFIILTSTISFFSNIDLATLEKSFLHDADITVSDGSNTIKLREYAFDTGLAYKFYVYTIDTANLANIMLGQVGKSYTLNINYDGKSYSAVTTIPHAKGLDTVWFGNPEFINSRTPDSARQLFCNYNDPDTMGNAVRYYTSRNGGYYYPVGIFNDEVVNGKRINNLGLYGGFENTADINADSMRYFYRGDTVTLKWCAIDKQVYNFWNSYDFASASVGNPFSAPINLISNLSNGALGIWGGYGSVYYTKVVQ